MKNKLPDIFVYNDYRNYISDYQKARYKYDRFFTKSEMCKRLGVPNTRSFINDVISRKRDLSVVYINRFISVLELNREQAQFFRCLVNFNQAENVEDRELFFDQLVALNRTPVRNIDKQSLLYYKEWYHGVVRALLEIVDVNNDYSILANKVHPPLTEKQVRQSMELLKELDLIRQNAEGYYKPAEKSISTGFYLSEDVIKNYQVHCLELAQKAVFQNIDQPQNITTRTISVSGEGYRRIEKKIQKFSSEIRAIVHKDENPPDRVYHLDLLLFPVSQ